MTKNDLHKFDIVYHARIHPSVGMYDVNELKIITIDDTYFTGIEKRTKQAFLFSYSAFGKDVFVDRQDALKKVKDAEANKIEVNNETYYEED